MVSWRELAIAALSALAGGTFSVVVFAWRIDDAADVVHTEALRERAALELRIQAVENELAELHGLACAQPGPHRPPSTPLRQMRPALWNWAFIKATSIHGP